MDSNAVIMAMLVLCGVLTVLVVMAEPIKMLLKFIFNSVISAAAIFVINYFFSFLGFNVGINIFTVAASAILGMPGIAALYITQLILR